MTEIATAGDAGKIATLVPGSLVPVSLDGIDFKSWTNAPTTLDGWNNVAGGAIKECFEELRLQVAITGIIGDFERSTSFAR